MWVCRQARRSQGAARTTERGRRPRACTRPGRANTPLHAHAGFEARGLIFGAPLALALGCAFVPLRKPGKLPGAWATGHGATAPQWQPAGGAGRGCAARRRCCAAAPAQRGLCVALPPAQDPRSRSSTSQNTAQTRLRCTRALCCRGSRCCWWTTLWPQGARSTRASTSSVSARGGGAGRQSPRAPRRAPTFDVLAAGQRTGRCVLQSARGRMRA